MDAQTLVARNAIAKHLRLTRPQANKLARSLNREDRDAVVEAVGRLEIDPAVPIRLITGPYRTSVPEYSGAGRRVRLRGEMNRPLGGGPNNGMYALQRGLHERIRRDGLDWLEISGEAHSADLIWFWNWQDVGELSFWDSLGRPYVCGPNILFAFSGAPCSRDYEKLICNSPHCRLIFTESDWYRELINAHRGPGSTCPLVLWPYPIDPQPAGPIFPAKYDLLILAKSGPSELPGLLAGRYARALVLRYGQFRRDELFAAARSSRACLYMSDDDRGPLALAEILLAGCPACGIERGAPWVVDGRTGIRLARLGLDEATEAVENLLEWDRREVRQAAITMFDREAIVDTVITALEQVRQC